MPALMLQGGVKCVPRPSTGFVFRNRLPSDRSSSLLDLQASLALEGISLSPWDDFTSLRLSPLHRDVESTTTLQGPSSVPRAGAPGGQRLRPRPTYGPPRLRRRSIPSRHLRLSSRIPPDQRTPSASSPLSVGYSRRNEDAYPRVTGYPLLEAGRQCPKAGLDLTGITAPPPPPSEPGYPSSFVFVTRRDRHDLTQQYDGPEEAL
jgi:hypothetical protein